MPLHLSKYAKLIVKYCVNVQKGDRTLILGPSEALPLITELYREAIRAGAHVTRPYIDFPGKDYIFHNEGQDFQLEYTDPIELFAIKNIDVLIMILGQTNTRELSNISMDKVKKKMQSFGTIMAEFYQRGATGELKWTMVPFPTVGMAQEAEMSQEEFSDLISETCFLNNPDPVAEWNKIARMQQNYCDFLSKVDKLRIVSKGTDISMSVKGRIWINSIGKQNLPDGEVFTGPIEDSVQGVITFTYPAVDRSHVMEDIVLKFKDGEVIEASATKGQNTLDSILKIPGARRVGEIAIGTNWAHTRFVGNIQFDEKLGGTIHLALGNGYPESGSKNHSDIHKDLLCDMKEEGKIYGDGNLIYEKGKFLF